MKILITGGNGQVAFDLKRIAKKNNIQFYAPTRRELYIADIEAVNAAFKEFQPDLAINTAAYTQVDQAERNIKSAFASNFFGAKHLAIVSQAFECPLIHLSTDYVFDGQSQIPYIETDITLPINVYGESKREGEKIIQEMNQNYMILRVSAVFGVHGHNFVKTIIKLAREKELLNIVSDQLTCPTPSSSIAETILSFANSFKTDVYHYCGLGAVSWYEFAKEIVSQAKQYEELKVKEIKPILTVDYPTLAKRPLYSVLNCEKIKKELNIQQPDWRTELHHVIKELYTA